MLHYGAKVEVHSWKKSRAGRCGKLVLVDKDKKTFIE